MTFIQDIAELPSSTAFCRIHVLNWERRWCFPSGASDVINDMCLCGCGCRATWPPWPIREFQRTWKGRTGLFLETSTRSTTGIRSESETILLSFVPLSSSELELSRTVCTSFFWEPYMFHDDSAGVTSPVAVYFLCVCVCVCGFGWMTVPAWPSPLRVTQLFPGRAGEMCGWSRQPGPALHQTCESTDQWVTSVDEKFLFFPSLCMFSV